VNFRIKSTRFPNAGCYDRRTVLSLRTPITLFLLVISFVCQAQYISYYGRFSVDQVKGCAPLTVKILNANLVAGDACNTTTPCSMIYQGTTQNGNLFTYTYTTPGTYHLTVIYQNVGPDSITIRVLPNIQPAFEVFTCSNYKVSLDVTDRNYNQYLINFGDGSPTDSIPYSNNEVATHSYGVSGDFPISIRGRNLNAADNCSPKVIDFQSLVSLPAPAINTLTCLDPDSLGVAFSTVNSDPNFDLHMQIAINNSTNFQLLQSLYGVTSDTITQLSLKSNYYCLRLSAYDPCSGGNTYSNVICSQIFTVTPQSQVNQLAWTTSATGITDYSISRNSTPYIITPSTSFSDIDVTCENNYCYQITSNYSNGSQSISLTQCVTAFSTRVPTLINNGSAVVSDGGVALTWLQDPNFIPTQYFVLRDENKGAFQNIALSTTMSYTDATYTTSGDYCYLINYVDQCKNNSATGSTICPIRLLGTVEKSNAIYLTWNNYKGWLNGVQSYTLQKFNQSGSLLTTFPLSLDTTFLDNAIDSVNQIVSYQVTATANAGGLIASVSNVALFTKEPNLYCPTAFTPNNDGRNDTFTIKGFFITRLEFNIFDRWGTLIYANDSSKPWDGKFNGRVMPNDTYVWTAKGSDLAGQNFSRSGTVVLLTPKK